MKHEFVALLEEYLQLIVNHENVNRETIEYLNDGTSSKRVLAKVVKTTIKL